MVDNQNNILVAFLRCSKNTHRKFSRFSAEIAHYGAYTDDWGWRFDVKEDDIFDCADDFGQWYRSTCLKTEILADETDIDGNTVPIITVGYRYAHPSGQKEDHKGRKCIGYTLPRFDTVLQLAGPNI